MPIKKLNSASNRILRMLVQFVIVLASFIYIDYLYLTNVRSDKSAEEKFTETKCFIMTKKLVAKGRFFRRYRADFLINYPANGAQYNRWVSGNGLDASYTSNNEQQKRILSDFEDGKNYKCWYNPKNPQEVILVLRKRWLSTSEFIIPGVIGFVALVLFLRNIGFIFSRLRDKKNKF